jgi:hypothetical protein
MRSPSLHPAPETNATIYSYICFLAFGGYEEDAPDKHTESRVVTPGHALFALGRRDDGLFHVSNCMIEGGLEEHISRQTIDIIYKSCNPPFNPKEAREKIDSALKRITQRERDIADELYKRELSTHSHVEVTQDRT